MKDGLAYGFDQVLPQLRGFKKLTRRGWNGKGMYIYLVPDKVMIAGTDNDADPLISLYGEGSKILYTDRIDMRYANGVFGPWCPSHEDLLATDWMVLV